LALGSLSRLAELNRRRRRNYEILTAELADCLAVQPISTTPGAVRGGFLEYVLRYEPAQAGGLSRKASGSLGCSVSDLELPATKALQGRLLTLPPFTKVSERFVRECARALRKVAESAPTGPPR
jgi:dTDP-4-amino-4,6-dideoxygalactose transaminase